MPDEFIYIGNSWAARSWDPPGTPKDENPTNLMTQWQLPAINLSQSATPILTLLKKIKSHPSKHPVVWIWGEPVSDLENITGMSFRDYLLREDWQDIRQECVDYCFREIDKLGVPILILGAHSDVRDPKLSNIKIGIDSWQKWSLGRCGIDDDLKEHWGVERIHMHIHINKDVDPVPTMVDNIYAVLGKWRLMQDLGWFYDVHPNFYSNEKFAAYTKPIVKTFLENCQ